MDRRQVGDPVFPSQGLHPGLHDRARLHGQDRARVHEAQRQAHRPERRPERSPTARWLDDIEETQGAKVNYPIIADHDLKVAKLYDMLPAEEPGTSEGRTAATNQTVRTVFVIGPDKKIKLMLAYPMTTGRNFDEILRVLELDAAHREAQGLDAGELEARARTSSSPARSATTTPRRCSRQAGGRRSPISASSSSRCEGPSALGKIPRRRSDPLQRPVWATQLQAAKN